MGLGAFCRKNNPNVKGYEATKNIVSGLIVQTYACTKLEAWYTHTHITTVRSFSHALPPQLGKPLTKREVQIDIPST